MLSVNRALMRLPSHTVWSTLLLSLLMVACTSVSTKTKRKLGMRSHYVSLATLGADYKAFKHSALDPFEASPKVKRLRGSQTVLIKYHSYKLRELDVSLERGSALYGAYRFANFVVDRFERDLLKALGAKWSRMSAAELAANLMVVKERAPDRYRALRASHSAVLLSIRADQTLVSGARALSEGLLGQGSGAIQSLKRSPKRSMLARDVLRDVELLIARLKRVEVGGPKLAKRLGGLKGVVTALSVVF